VGELDAVNAAHAAYKQALKGLDGTRPGTTEHFIAEEHIRQAKADFDSLIASHVARERSIKPKGK